MYRCKTEGVCRDAQDDLRNCVRARGWRLESAGDGARELNTEAKEENGGKTQDRWCMRG